MGHIMAVIWVYCQVVVYKHRYMGRYNYLYILDENAISSYNNKTQFIVHDIYYGKARLPTYAELQKSEDNDIRKIVRKYKDESVDVIRTSISQHDEWIPLYDIVRDNLYIVWRTNVFDKVFRENYRFPRQDIRDIITKKMDALMIKKNKHNKDDNTFIDKKYHKLRIGLDFLNNFDETELYSTYMRTIYLYSSNVGKNISDCVRPSFNKLFTHIKPYYSRNEIINIMKNKGMEVDPYEYIDNDMLRKLCNEVSQNDVRAATLMSHQEYIIKHEKVCLLQYYSLNGSYFINTYMRNIHGTMFKDKYMEEIIATMWELVKDAPEFDNEYVLYRFISNDGFINHLNVGDIFMDKGFVSTTRNPFYEQTDYKFGYILMKIKIPANVKGVGLCIENLSYFPNEQEIILPPRTMLRLDKRDDNIIYSHTNPEYNDLIKTKYEFTLLGSDKITFENYPKTDDIKFINFVDIKTVRIDGLYEKIRYFQETYTRPLNKFNAKIGDKTYTIVCEEYNSTSVYRDYYSLHTMNGFGLYCFVDNNMLFYVEIGTDINHKPIMHVDYNKFYLSVNKHDIFGFENYLSFICQIAYYFDIYTIKLYAEYVTCDRTILDEKTGKKYRVIPMKYQTSMRNISDPGMGVYHGGSRNRLSTPENKDDEDEMIMNVSRNRMVGGTHCMDIYDYIKHGQRVYDKYKLLKTEIVPSYSYFELDRMKQTDPAIVLSREDRDELYNIYQRDYLTSDHKPKLDKFYIWIVDHYCNYVELLIDKMGRIFADSMNPFILPYYYIDPMTYLYNRKIIAPPEDGNRSRQRKPRD